MRFTKLSSNTFRETTPLHIPSTLKVILMCMFRLVHLNVSSCKNLSNAGVRAICQIAPQLETLVLSNCQNISMETARFVQLYYYQLLYP